jgi:hypothetical protein
MKILNLYEYEKVREARRRAVIDHKKARRVQVGRYLSFAFEDRQTVWFQIQEMCRAERTVDDAKIAEELAVYHRLLPGPGERAATMFIEIEEASRIQPVLDALLGIDTRDYVRLEVGSHTVVGTFETGHSDEERGKISAVHFVHFVHFVRFRLPLDAQQNFARHDVTLVVDHPNERTRTLLSPETKRSLSHDLA